MLRPGAIYFFFSVQRKLKVSVICMNNKNPDSSHLSPLNKKNSFVHNFDEVDDCSESSQAHRLPRHWGNY